MRNRHWVRDWEHRRFVSVFRGGLVFLASLFSGASVGHAGDVITTVVPGETGGIADIAIGPADQLYILRGCYVEKLMLDGHRWVVPPTEEQEIPGPTGLAVDQEGNIYVSEYGQERLKPVVQEPLRQCTMILGEVGVVWKITPGGDMTLLLGSLYNNFFHSYVVGVDGDERLYFWRFGQGLQLWRLDREGEQVVVGGTGVLREPADLAFEDVDGKLATEVNFFWPVQGGGGCVDVEGNIYLAQGPYVLQIDGQTGVITIVAGNGRKEYSGDGGPAREAGLVDVRDVVKDRWGNLYVADLGGFRVRWIDPHGIITTVAGTGEGGHTGDGGDPRQAAVIPEMLAVDSQGQLYVANSFGGDRVRKITFAPRPTLVEAEEAHMGTAAPLELRLESAPNPANREMVISYTLPSRTWFRLEVVDLLGRRVRTLAQGLQETGDYQVVWDGQDQWGRVISSGMYILSLQASDQGIATQKVVMLK